MIQNKPSVDAVRSLDHSALAVGPSTHADKAGGVVPKVPPAAAGTSIKPTTHALALASGVDGLSDNNLRQLMDEMNNFDALPATEPGPVISVDNGEGLDQGSR
jgi:hypothetical protein